jgi:enoyl-CoA hydratase
VEAVAVLEFSVHGRTAVLRLNRPESLNALNTELIGALEDALTRVQRDPALDVHHHGERPGLLRGG